MTNSFKKYSNMPKVGSLAISMFSDVLTLVKNRQTMSEGDVVTVQTKTAFKGAIQPLQAKQIEMKPIGQRAWSWWQIHCVASVKDVTVNDSIIFQKKTYKVMEVMQYERNGYIEYHVVEQFR